MLRRAPSQIRPLTQKPRPILTISTAEWKQAEDAFRKHQMEEFKKQSPQQASSLSIILLLARCSAVILVRGTGS
jgi:hypothetical protein